MLLQSVNIPLIHRWTGRCGVLAIATWAAGSGPPRAGYSQRRKRKEKGKRAALIFLLRPVWEPSSPLLSYVENLPQGLCGLKWSSPMQKTGKQLRHTCGFLPIPPLRCFHTSLLLEALPLCSVNATCHFMVTVLSSHASMGSSQSGTAPRLVARINFGGCRIPKKWTFWNSPS